MEKQTLTPAIIISHIVLIIMLILVLFPAFWVLSTSFSGINTLQTSSILPAQFTFDNYVKLIKETPFLTWMKNSLIICVTSTVIALFLTTTAGYAFSRFKFAGRRFGLMAMIIAQMFPGMMAMVALFKLLNWLGFLTSGAIGLNTLSGLILIYAGGSIPFNTWMLKGYIDSIPKSIEESAYIDGATKWQTFTQIVFPLLGPMLVVVAIFSFILPYTDFLLPVILLQDPEKYTVAVGLRSLVSGQFTKNWNMFTAAATLGAIPIMVMFLSLQRFLVEGLTKGAVKG
ncbi:MAG TPA: sugar ABC transporter permease [Candidatus Eremiobacteraeota bacterium]|nr:MAG: Maltose transport system permease protein MalG [bacterium ADurb.Bin363]HPZ07470.1 sugar ABC transporter permease [Candidatus Eremiobacteraeota bacterium]